MSFPGGLFSSIDRVLSQAKANLKIPVVGTGDEILAIPVGLLKVGMLFSVTANSTGNALTVGVYQWNGSGFASPQGGVHTHEGASSGGSMNDIMMKSLSNLWFVDMWGPTFEQFARTGTNATYANITTGTTKYVEITTGTTTNNHGNLRYGGILYTFAQPSAFVTRIKLASSTTNSTARVGMNMETADSLTDNKVKYGFEGCATCNSSNISVVSSEGTLRSKNTQSSDNYSTVGNFMMRLDPGVNVKWRKEAGTIITKTDRVPASGVPDRNCQFMACIQTTNTTSKTLDLYGFAISAMNGETNMPSI